MAYIGKSPTGTGVRQRYYFTATGGETSLSGTDDNGLTLSYSDGAYVDVLLNGIELVAGTDYNTTTANTIAGLSALAASDVVTVTVYDIFTVADTVSAKDGGTFSGNVNLNGTTTTSGTLDVNSTLDISSSNFKMTDLNSNAFYRTGTFTPVWSSASATDTTASITTGTYGSQVGVYVRIGDLVFYSIHLQSPSTWTYTNNGAAGQTAYISGLPFKGANSNGAFEQWGGAVNYYDNWTFSAGYSIQPLVRNNDTHIRLYYNIANQAVNVLTTSIDNADSLLYVTGVYRTEDA